MCDEYEVDFIVLARYMRILPAASCWKYAGGRIINLHHGLLPSFPGMQPYHEAFASRMLTYGCTCHFIVPELDAGNQIIYQSTFTVPPGMPLRRDHPPRPGRQRAALPGRRRPPRGRRRSAAALQSRGREIGYRWISATPSITSAAPRRRRALTGCSGNPTQPK